MKNEKPLYIVTPRDNSSLDEIYAIFDSQSKLDDFLNRFKTRPNNLEVITRIINPTFYSDKTNDPYYLVFDKTTIIPKEIFICDSILMVEDAKIETHNISFYPQHGEDDGIFIYQCMAIDKKEAIHKAVAKRDALIGNGDWKKAWVNYNLNRIKASRR